MLAFAFTEIRPMCEDSIKKERYSRVEEEITPKFYKEKRACVRACFLVCNCHDSVTEEKATFLKT